MAPRIHFLSIDSYGIMSGSGIMPMMSEPNGLNEDKCPHCGAQQKCEYCQGRVFENGRCKQCGAPQK